MKKLSVLFVLLFVGISSLLAQDYHKGRIVVKVNQLNKINELKIELNNFLKDYEVNRLLSDNTQRLLNNKIENRNQFLSTKKYKNYKLYNIWVVDYNDNIDPVVLSSKINNLSYVEYAEPQYIREVFYEFPNDTLVSEQYALFNCQVIEALDLLDGAKDTVVISVVDTGLDYLHDDLQNIMWVNPGEDGIDNNGKNKRENGIDDDENGFVDDWRGWDFGSSDSTGQDNDPYPGGGHGTHVAGIIAANSNNVTGIAGINPYAKILPVKIGFDNPWIRNLINSYEGLLYAAMMGADVINNSWGGGGYSEAENEIIQQANEFGALIVAAAGNNNENTKFYPASYDNVLSVASTDDQDRRSGFSNYHYVVDVAAPGTAVMSTIPDSSYAAWSGTSMASPVAAAIAGLIKIKYPDYNNMMLGEHLKATSDNIDSLNFNYLGLIGRGRVNAYRAITDTNLYSLNIQNIEIIQLNSNRILLGGDTIRIRFSFLNTLKPLTNVNLVAESQFINQQNFINKEINIGDFQTMESKYPDEYIEVIIPDIEGLDIELPINFDISSDENFNIKTRVSVLINPSYRTLDKNNISVTVGSIGTIGFNDYPVNAKGDGFTWKGGSNVLFEGALMIGVDTVRVSDVARAGNASRRSDDFSIIKSIKDYFPGLNSTIETEAQFQDGIDSASVGVIVDNFYYQYNVDPMKDCVIGIYDVINRTENKFDSLFVGNYFDWDIGPGGSYNFAYWDYDNEVGICYNTKDETLPIIGMMQISDNPVNFFAIDNDGSSQDNPGVYDGFPKIEKWKMMSSGIGRDSTGIKDVSTVISAGPIELESKDTSRVIMAYFAAANIDELLANSKAIREFMKSPSSITEDFNPFLNTNFIKNIYPNPSSGNFINVELYEFDKNIKINLFDINGKIVKSIENITNSSFKLDVSDLLNGSYLLEINLGKEKEVKKLIIKK